MPADYFLKLEGIEGESSDDKHKGEIDIESWSWGESNAVTAGGSAAGKVQIQDFHFVMKSSKASPKLFVACASGQHIREAILTGYRTDTRQQEFIKWTLTDVLISSYDVSGAAADTVPTEQVSLNFGQVNFAYTSQKEDGSSAGTVEGSWDVRKNTSG